MNVIRSQGHPTGGEYERINPTRAGQQHLQHEHTFREVQQVPQPQASATPYYAKLTSKKSCICAMSTAGSRGMIQGREK